MKRFIISVVLVLSYFIAFSQAIKRDKAGNFVSAKGTAKVTDTKTSFTFTDPHGKVWPVYHTARGKFYALKVSKTGKAYKYYLTEK